MNITLNYNIDLTGLSVITDKSLINSFSCSVDPLFLIPDFNNTPSNIYSNFINYLNYNFGTNGTNGVYSFSNGEITMFKTSNLDSFISCNYNAYQIQINENDIETNYGLYMNGYLVSDNIITYFIVSNIIINSY